MTEQRPAAAAFQTPLPQPEPEPPPIVRPEDRPYPGVLQLSVDATDVEHGVFRVEQSIPVAGPGPLTLLYPKWLPGFHSPAACIELLAGVEIRAGERLLDWRRDPVEVHAFHIDVPDDCERLDCSFQYLSPTSTGQGSLDVTGDMMWVHWGSMVLYPAGYFSRQIQVAPELRLPEGWTGACALEARQSHAGAEAYAPVSLDVLVDSPVLAGRHTKTLPLDDPGRVSLFLAAEQPYLIAAAEERLEPHRNLVAEADTLFGSRHFDRFHFLAAVGDEIGGGGVEHHRCCELVVPSAYFTAWDANAPRRDVFAHEYVHSWNGKFRRGADSWTPSFERPIRNSLMWVYEGQTQYWGEVLAVRSGLWTPQQALDTYARIAAVYSNRPGGCWRPMSDTTRDPIITGRQPQPWPSWQRAEDYYAEGQLLWLDVDTLIRELSGDTRSLDDFARRFFGIEDGRMATSTYDFDDVVAALDGVAQHDWRQFLVERLESREVGAPLDGLTRGGYRLVYRPSPSDFALATDKADGVLNLRFSIGVTISDDGTLQEVIWEGPAFKAGAVAGAKVLAVNGRAYGPEDLKQAIVEAQQSGGLELMVQRGKRHQALDVRYDGGLRFPHLERIEGARPRLDEILKPRRPK